MLMILFSKGFGSLPLQDPDAPSPEVGWPCPNEKVWLGGVFI